MPTGFTHADSSRGRRTILLLLVALGCWGAVAAARAVLRVTQGLRGHYFANAQWTGPPAFSTVDSEISTARVSRQWNNTPPDTFSARWTGYLNVGQSGLYRFATTSDAGSWLFVDNRLVVNNGGAHHIETQVGRVWLDRGSHLLRLEYAHSGGSYAMDWSWASGDAPFSSVPRWVLSPRRHRYWTATLARALDWVCLAAAIACGLLSLRLLLPLGLRLWPWVALPEVDERDAGHGTPYEHAGEGKSLGRRRSVACLALFIGLAILETWPLATNPARLSRSTGDTMLCEWILAWVAHQAPRAPLHLFDANIFYPERNTLAYSESLLVQATMGAPLLWAGASPVLTYNLLLLAGFALTGWTMCLVVARWTRDWVAGIAAGVLVAFCAHSLTRLSHLQAQHVEFFPLTLLAFDALLRQPRLRHAVWLAVWFTLQALASYYLLVLTTVALIAAAVARPNAWWGKRFSSRAPYFALAASLATLGLLPFLLPYWHAYHDQGLTRSLEDLLAASWRDYLTTPARFDHWLLERWSSQTGLFPGAAGLALAGVAVATGVAVKDPRPRMCLAFGICGVVLSFGTAIPGYALLYRVFPVLQGLRAVARFGYLGTVAVAVTAGYGVAELRRRIQGYSWAPAAVVLIPVVLTLESLAAPISYRRFNGIPAIYHQLDGARDAVVAELPFPPPDGPFFNAPYMLNSTINWNPTLNGYSGFLPDSYVAHYQALRSFPSPESVTALQTYGVSYVFVHLDALDTNAIAQLHRAPGLLQMAVDGPLVLYRVATRSTGSGF